MDSLNKIINDSQNETIKNLNKVNQILNNIINNKCEFCDSLETIKYPAEGQGDVYLCEDCRSRSND